MSQQMDLSQEEIRSLVNKIRQRSEAAVPIFISLGGKSWKGASLKQQLYIFEGTESLITLNKEVQTSLIKDNHLSSDQAIYLYIGSNMPRLNMTMAEAYNKFKNESDGLLYITVQTQAAFGSFGSDRNAQ